MSEPLFQYKVVNTLKDGMKDFAKQSQKWQFEAEVKVALQLLNFVLNGSKNQSVVPPIKTGMLRGSGSVFVDSRNVGTSPRVSGQGKPNTNYGGKKHQITIGFNTAYAARWHEEEFNPGEFSRQSGDVGNKYVEKHLRDDKEILMEMYAKVLNKFM